MSAGGSRNHSYLNADQLHVHAHGVATLLHASFKDVRNTKLLGDLGEIPRQRRRRAQMLRRA
jgi:hypothetical protein